MPDSAERKERIAARYRVLKQAGLGATAAHRNSRGVGNFVAALRMVGLEPSAYPELTELRKRGRHATTADPRRALRTVMRRRFRALGFSPKEAARLSQRPLQWAQVLAACGETL